MVPTVSVMFALFFNILLPVQAQLNVTLTWEGNLVTGPILIYHDELRLDGNDNPMLGDVDGQGALVCRSQTRPRVFWRNTAGADFPDTETSGGRNDINQIRSGPNDVPSISRLSRGTTTSPTDNLFDGLLLCRLNTEGDVHDVLANFRYVGLYNRQRSGAGVITIDSVDIVDMDSIFLGNPPEFNLRADTSGGPPEEYYWTRNGQRVSDDDAFDIFLIVVTTLVGNQPRPDALGNSRYNNTLIVRGNLPGEYEYTVGNRATSPMVTSSFNIEGAPPTNVMLQQIDISMVRVTWTAPAFAPPVMGYRTRVAIGNQMSDAVDEQGTSADVPIITGQYGRYVARVMSLSQHLPGGTAESEEVAVLGNLAPVISEVSAAATSVTIMWTQPQFSREVTSYTITVTARATTGTGRCSQVVEDDCIASTQPGVTTTILADLEEFREYRVTVLATFISGFGLNNPTAESTSMNFETLNAAPTMGPRDVMATQITSRTVQVTWDTIECIHRNGLITDYEVQLREDDSGVIVFNNMVDSDTTTSMASGLRPFTSYTFQVAGVNVDGTGVFTEIDFNTLEDTPGPVFNLTAGPKFISVILEWEIPREPNGNIIAYEVTYRVGSTSRVTRNTTDSEGTRLEIPDVPTQTTVSEIAVTAYTSVGRGEESTHPDVVTPAQPEIPVVRNVMAMTLSDTAVRVTWNPLLLIGIVGYRVYYRPTSGSRKRQSVEQAVRVEGANSGSTTITGLQGGVQYQFQVVALAGTEEAEGPRSVLNGNSMTTTNPDTTNTDLTSPGPVFNLTAGPKFISVILEWEPPQEPNGNIIAYEVTYRVGNTRITVNTTDLNTRLEIPDVPTQTTVSEITVTAYTSEGRGEESTHPDVITPAQPEIPMIRNVRVEALSDTAVRVTWNPLLLTGIVGYRVYYRPTSGSRKRQSVERSVRVEGATSGSVTITDLQGGVQYQFQVVALGLHGGEEFEGARSVLDSNSMTTTDCSSSDITAADLATAVVVTFVLASVLTLTVVLLIVYCSRKSKQNNQVTLMTNVTDKTQREIDAAADASAYEVIPQNIRGDVGMEMKPNTAYGPVSSSLPRPQVAAGSEDTYESV